MEQFVNTISQPISRDGHEHIDYVPSQVVSEFFAQVFRSEELDRIDGMIYPSAVVRGGQNMVIFPSGNMLSTWSHRFDLIKVDQLFVKNWERFAALISA